MPKVHGPFAKKASKQRHRAALCKHLESAAARAQEDQLRCWGKPPQSSPLTCGPSAFDGHCYIHRADVGGCSGASGALANGLCGCGLTGTCKLDHVVPVRQVFAGSVQLQALCGNCEQEDAALSVPQGFQATILQLQTQQSSSKQPCPAKNFKFRIASAAGAAT